MALISEGLSVRPWILARTASRLSGDAAGVTVTRQPAGSANRWNAGSARPSSSGPTSVSSSVMSNVAKRTLEFRRTSTRLKPRNTSGRRALDRREITATFSRPVSRLTRRILNCGRDCWRHSSNGPFGTTSGTIIASREAPLTQIITVTPNPAIDLLTSISKLEPFSKLRCTP